MEHISGVGALEGHVLEGEWPLSQLLSDHMAFPELGD